MRIKRTIGQGNPMKRTAGLLVSSLICLQIADSAMTMWATNHGYKESNPIMAPIAQTWWLLPYKVLPALLVGIAVVWAVGRVPMVPTVVAIGMGLTSVFLILVLVGNIMELV